MLADAMLAITCMGILMLTPERRKEIATLAAKARWKGKVETVRITLTVSTKDHADLERLRVSFGLASQASVVRKLVRDAAKEKLK